MSWDRLWFFLHKLVTASQVGSTWCLCESGACGPTFNFPDVTSGCSRNTDDFLQDCMMYEVCEKCMKRILNFNLLYIWFLDDLMMSKLSWVLCTTWCWWCFAGFTAIFVSGPIERGVFVESGHNDREANMWDPQHPNGTTHSKQSESGKEKARLGWKCP